MKVDLTKIKTESQNELTKNIDLLDTIDIVSLINEEDKKVAYAVEKEKEKIAKLIDAVVDVFNNGGRLIYMGAGTSGRVGIIDAVECRPTFGVSDDMVFCLMAGGINAFVKAVEGAEDNKELAINDLKNVKLSCNDIVIGIAASGRTPYVVGGIEYANKIGAKTGAIVTSPNSLLAGIVSFPVEVIVGSEVITGSTRMKSGTAQKMVCNMITTTAMIKLGKVYGNLMIDVMPTNEKLKSRAINILITASGINEEEAHKKLEKFGTVKKALFSILSGIDDVNKVEDILNKNKGHIRKALEEVKGE